MVIINVVSLAKDRTLYFDKENPLKYKEYDLHVLADIAMKCSMKQPY